MRETTRQDYAMRLCKALTCLLLLAMVLVPCIGATLEPFTQEQVRNMVRAGKGNESGAKLIEERVARGKVAQSYSAPSRITLQYFPLDPK